jgi:hypothetical protein
MNGNGSTWAYDDETIESYDDWDDESVSSTAEIIPELLSGGALGGIARLIKGPSRPPVPTVRVRPPSRGVDTAKLSTPRGEATLRLPDKVVTLDVFRQTTERLEAAINRNTARLNTTQKDIESLSNRVGTVVTNLQKDHKAAVEKLRKERDPQGMQMLMPILMQQQLQEQIEDHTHSIPAGATETGSATLADDDNMALMMMPLLMGGSSSDDSNMMMMLVMMMALQDRDRN